MSISEPFRRADDIVSLVDRLGGEFARILSFYRIPQQDAEDLLQDTLLLFLTKRAEVRTPAAWLAGALRNRCLRYWRARRNRLLQAIDRGLLEELVASEEPTNERAVLAHDLSNALARLPDRCQSVLRMRYGLGYAGAEMAEKLGYTEATVRQIAHRCLSALSRQMLGPDSTRTVAR